MSRARVLVPSKVAPAMLDVLRAYETLDVDAPGDLTQQALAEAIVPADAVIIRSNNTMTAAVIGAAPRLRVIGRAGAGVDNVDVEAATRRGIVVMNTPGENAVATAEHTFAMLLSLARRIPAADSSIKAGKWERSRFQGMELYGKTLGIVGLGRIGREVARRAAAFGMKIIAFDPFLPEDAMIDSFVNLVGDLGEVLEASHFVTVHVPLSAETRALIGASEIARMRSGSYILNCARGGLVDEAALCDALDSGHLAGAALDVFETEPPGERRAVSHAKIVATPHVGGSTAEAQSRVGISIARQVGDFLTRGIAAHAVNVPPLAGPWAAWAD